VEVQLSLQQCLSQLADADPVVRCKALDGLAEMTYESSAAVKAILKALKDPHDDSPEAVDELIEALDDDDAIREQAIKALANIGPAASGAVSRLIEELEEGSFAELAADALGCIGPPEAEAAIPVLEMYLDSPAASCRVAAARALGRIRYAAGFTVPTLVNALKEEEFFAAAQLKCDAIPPMPHPALEELVLDDQPGYVRVVLAVALWRIARHELALPTIVAGLHDPVFGVRRRAIYALREIGLPAGAYVADLIQALRDPEERVRATAVEVLPAFGAGAIPAIPAMEEALRDENLQVRMKAAEAVGELGPLGMPVVPALINLMSHLNGRVSVPAAMAVWKITRHIAPLVALCDALGADDPRISEAAAIALGEIGRSAKPTLKALKAIVKDQTEYRYVRRAAAEAIRKIAGTGG
jgi:HEAT repeat protein